MHQLTKSPSGSDISFITQCKAETTALREVKILPLRTCLAKRFERVVQATTVGHKWGAAVPVTFGQFIIRGERDFGLRRNWDNRCSAIHSESANGLSFVSSAATARMMLWQAQWHCDVSGAD